MRALLAWLLEGRTRRLCAARQAYAPRRLGHTEEGRRRPALYCYLMPRCAALRCAAQALEGVSMELEDSLYPLLRSVTIGTDPYSVFEVGWALGAGGQWAGQQRGAKGGREGGRG